MMLPRLTSSAPSSKSAPTPSRNSYAAQQVPQFSSAPSAESRRRSKHSENS